jgi:hypothetical protein
LLLCFIAWAPDTLPSTMLVMCVILHLIGFILLCKPSVCSVCLIMHALFCLWSCIQPHCLIIFDDLLASFTA